MSSTVARRKSSHKCGKPHAVSQDLDCELLHNVQWSITQLWLSEILYVFLNVPFRGYPTVSKSPPQKPEPSKNGGKRQEMENTSAFRSCVMTPRSLGSNGKAIPQPVSRLWGNSCPRNQYPDCVQAYLCRCEFHSPISSRCAPS